MIDLKGIIIGVLVVAVIVVVIFLIVGKLEGFENINGMKVLVFTSNSCGWCKVYHEKTHNDLKNKLNLMGIELEEIVADNDKDNKFDKYGVMYVPAIGVLKNGSFNKIDGPIETDKVINYIKNN